MKLDFDTYIKVEHGYLLFPTPDDKFRVFPDIYDRICVIIYISSKIGSKPEKYGVSSSALNAAYVRSALCELIALEERIEQKYINIEPTLFKIYKTKDPILHMVKLLRNYNIHVSSSSLSQKPMMVRTLVENIPEFEINVEYINNLSVEAIRSLRSGKNYTVNQIEQMLTVFDSQQHEFGISTLLIKVALSYLERLEPVLVQKVHLAEGL